MTQLFDLSNRVAIVTGSSKGIGRATARALAAHGAKVVVSSRDASACESVVKEIRTDGGQAVAIACHVGREEQLEQLVERTRAELGPIGVLVANAAISPYYGPGIDMPDAAFEKTLQVNVRYVHRLCQLVVPDMRAQRDGSIILISSVGALRGNPMMGAYNVSKAALLQMARNLAVELGPDRIRANCIVPGLVKTDMARVLWENPELAKRRAEQSPLKRLGEPEDIAGAAVFLASPASGWMTGQSIVIDGGATISA